jgi:hypothetical protein
LSRFPKDLRALIGCIAIVIKERSNANRGHETAAQTEELFRILIPQADAVTLREALHVLDPDGNTLVHNIAIRGFDSLLRYVLELETPARRLAMVNACTKTADGRDKSVYEAVIEKLRELNDRIRINRYTDDRRIKEFLVEKGNQLQRCKHLLLSAGAVTNPSVTVCLYPSSRLWIGNANLWNRNAGGSVDKESVVGWVHEFVMFYQFGDFWVRSSKRIIHTPMPLALYELRFKSEGAPFDITFAFFLHSFGSFGRT